MRKGDSARELAKVSLPGQLLPDRRLTERRIRGETLLKVCLVARAVNLVRTRTFAAEWARAAHVTRRELHVDFLTSCVAVEARFG